ncbi:hypothetical protein [Paraburkholderia fungorum]
MTQCYHYDAATGASLSLIGEADESPLEPGVYHTPANATLVPPPDAGPHQVPVFVEKTGAWELQPDWRGVALYRTLDGSATGIAAIGRVPADIDATDQPMPGPE